jgi:hypothetical protein
MKPRYLAVAINVAINLPHQILADKPPPTHLTTAKPSPTLP